MKRGYLYIAVTTLLFSSMEVALKLISEPYSADPVFRERLFREANTAGRLHEPHVVPIHSFGSVVDHLYIDMALIEKARQCAAAEPRGRHLIGVDPAEYGDDDTGIAHRQGRVIHSIEGRHGQSQIETANYIARKFGHLREEAEVKALAREASTVWVPAPSARTRASSTPARSTTEALTL